MINTKDYADKSIILFWGAGMSLNSGAPIVGTFMETLYNKLGFVKDGEEIKEFWKRKLPFEQNMDTLHEAAPEAFPTILKAFNNNRLKPNDAHTWLQQNHQKIYAIVTTNFDTLIETALAEKNLLDKVYYQREELEKTSWEDKKNSSSIPVIKIHGSIEGTSDMAITFKEIVKNENLRAVTNILEALFKNQKEKNIFFMGYSFSDVLDIVPALKTLEINKTNTITVVWHNRYAKKNEKKTKNLNEAGFFDELAEEKKENPFHKKATAGSQIWYCNTSYLFCDEIKIKIPCVLPEIGEYVEVLLQDPGLLESVKANLCQDVQLYDKSIEYFENALKIMLETKGEIHHDIAILSSNLGSVYLNKGEYDKAIEYLNESLKILIQTVEKKHPSVATTHNNLGVVYNCKGEYDKAIEYHGKAMKIRLDTLGEKHPDVADSYNNLGSVYNSKKEYNKAVEYYNKALKIQIEKLGEKHPDIADTYNNLGSVYRRKEKYNRAKKYFKKALKIGLEALEKKHIAIATTHNNFGLVYINKEKYDKAIKCLNKSLKIRLEILGDKHIDVANSYNNLGGAYTRKKQYDKAEEYFKKALSIRRDILGENHPAVANTYNNLGSAYDNKGEYDKAIEYYEKALKIKLEILGEMHPYVAEIYNNLAIVYEAKGSKAKAEEYRKKAQQSQNQ